MHLPAAAGYCPWRKRLRPANPARWVGNRQMAWCSCAQPARHGLRHACRYSSAGSAISSHVAGVIRRGSFSSGGGDGRLGRKHPSVRQSTDSRGGRAMLAVKRARPQGAGRCGGMPRGGPLHPSHAGHAVCALLSHVFQGLDYTQPSSCGKREVNRGGRNQHAPTRQEPVGHVVAAVLEEQRGAVQEL